MQHDLICQFEVYTTAKDMWDVLSDYINYRCILTRLRQLLMHYNSYKMYTKHSMAVHLRNMSVLTRDLDAASNVLTKKQQIQAVLGALSKS